MNSALLLIRELDNETPFHTHGLEIRKSDEVKTGKYAEQGALSYLTYQGRRVEISSEDNCMLCKLGEVQTPVTQELY